MLPLEKSFFDFRLQDVPCKSILGLLEEVGMLFLRSLSIGCLIVIGALADPITLQIAPQFVTEGQTVNEGVVISGLGLPPEVGAFDIFIGFDPSLLTPTNVEFGPLLGDPSLFEALTAFSLNVSNVEAAEVSLLPTSDLDALQSSSFTLATISFVALANGTADFSYLGGPIDDGNGVLIFGTKVVPEPPSIVSLATCLVALAWLVRYRRPIGQRNS
jgi:hypothetical protein